MLRQYETVDERGEIAPLVNSQLSQLETDRKKFTRQDSELLSLSESRYLFSQLLQNLDIYDSFVLYRTCTWFKDLLKGVSDLGIVDGNQAYSLSFCFKAVELRPGYEQKMEEKKKLENSPMAIITADDNRGFNTLTGVPCLATSLPLASWGIIGTPILAFALSTQGGGCCTASTCTTAGIYGVGLGFGGALGCAALSACGYPVDRFYRVTGLRVQDKVEKIGQSDVVKDYLSHHDVWTRVIKPKERDDLKIQEFDVRVHEFPPPLTMRK